MPPATAADRPALHRPGLRWAAALATALAVTCWAPFALGEDSTDSPRRFVRPVPKQGWTDKNDRVRRDHAAPEPAPTTPARASTADTMPSASNSKLKWRPRQPIAKKHDEASTVAQPVSLGRSRNVQASLELHGASGQELAHDNQVRGLAWQDQISDEPSLPGLEELPEDEPALMDRLRDLDDSEISVEEQLAQERGFYEQPCPTPSELKPISEITNRITAEAGEFPTECSLGDEQFEPRMWALTTYTWTAPALCHKPLYFEEMALERYGHSTGPLTQPFVSGAHFFATLPVLPYKMGVEPPWECIYPLGYYRPGSCAPYMLYPIPLSARGALLEAGAWVGGVFLIP